MNKANETHRLSEKINLYTIWCVLFVCLVFSVIFKKGGLKNAFVFTLDQQVLWVGSHSFMF